MNGIDTLQATGSLRPRFHVPGREIGYVLDEYEQQRDPLGIGETGDPGQDVHMVVRRAVEGVDAPTTQKLIDALRDRSIETVAGLDQLTARLMVRCGVDPLVMTWLAAVSADIATTEDADCTTVATVDLSVPYDDGDTVTRADLGGNAFWMSPGVIEMNPVPETISTIVVGGPLAAVLSHPVLDAHPFLIRSIDTENGRSKVTVSYEDQWFKIRAATVEELANMLREHRGEEPCAII